jgi:hypothetical protein
LQLLLFFIFDEIIVLKNLFLICFLYFQIPLSFCQSHYFQQQVNYTIDVTLNDIQMTLDGFEIINYTNNSPDTLNYIWFHLWPNAYKNDRTAFSEQLLQLGKTDFYFSNENKRGYINRLDFKVNGITANLEDHPQYIDVAKLILPSPLLPRQTIKIATPFHEKIPFNFSRGGYVDHTFQITQWYPKPAVYDSKGWHPMPYLDQGEFYSEFGNFHVQITVPKDYTVAATGEMVSGIRYQVSGKKEATMSNQQSEIRNQQSEASKELPSNNKKKKEKKRYQPTTKRKKIINKAEGSKLKAESLHLAPSETKTLTYIQNNVHDFAWFADKNFIVKYDTLKLPSGRIIDVYAFYTPAVKNVWKNSIQFMKDAINTRSRWLGEYPYNIVTTVEAKMGFSGGMEYPTITSISPVADEKSLDMLIEHEVGHNWLYGILATNEREFPWMDEGMNTYFDNRYEKLKYPEKNSQKKEDFLEKKIPKHDESLTYSIQIATKKDQPVETASQDFSETNYDAIAYYKTGLWMKKLEDFVGKDLFDSCLHEYYERWKFKHPYPEDFKKVVEEVSKKNVDTIFSLLAKKGRIEPVKKKEFKISAFFNFRNTDKYNYLFLSPAIGKNYYDKLMLGAFIHNYTLPEQKFQFFVAPLYATGSRKLTGIGDVNYHWYPDNQFQKIQFGLNGSTFSMNHSLDTSGNKIFESFAKLTPYIKIYFKTNILSKKKSWLDFRSYIITENSFNNFKYKTGSDSVISYPTSLQKTHRYINQLSFNFENDRALYPYNYELQMQQGKGFYRINATGNYFFNYAKGGGLAARIFAAKFGYIGTKDFGLTYQYEPKLLSANGTDDYTYSNYFIGRTASTSYGNIPLKNDGIAAQQIMIENTGGLKFRLDPVSSQWQSENWIAAINLKSTLPNDLLPANLPVRIFFDAGTYAEAWQKNASSSKFLYVGGLQLSILKNIVNVYVPLIYSNDFKEYLKTDQEANKFLKKITFSIDIQNFRLSDILNIPDL